jgi:uncharacterized protein
MTVGPLCRPRTSTKEYAVTGPSVLSADRCIELMETRGVGRAAICGQTGPMVYPVNYVVDGRSIVFRTSAYSALGTGSIEAGMAFEVDHIETDHNTGWSVVATGIAEHIDDEAELDDLRERGLEPAPWVPGLRRTYVRLTWDAISGREVALSTTVRDLGSFA